MELAKILFWRGSRNFFYVNGVPMPPISPDIHIERVGYGVIEVTVTFLADEVTILDRSSAKLDAADIVARVSHP